VLLDEVDSVVRDREGASCDEELDSFLPPARVMGISSVAAELFRVLPVARFTVSISISRVTSSDRVATDDDSNIVEEADPFRPCVSTTLPPATGAILFTQAFAVS
jgi:hypothetical protein